MCVTILCNTLPTSRIHTHTHTHCKYVLLVLFFMFNHISQLPQAISLSTSRKCIISNHCVVDLKTKLWHNIYNNTSHHSCTHSYFKVHTMVFLQFKSLAHNASLYTAVMSFLRMHWIPFASASPFPSRPIWPCPGNKEKSVHACVKM